MRSEIAAALAQKIVNRSAKIGIVGMGYVGLPLAIAFAAKDFEVIGFDIDPAKVEAIGRGQSYLKHITETSIAGAFVGTSSWATTDFSNAALADALLVCVPTPLESDRTPDLSYVNSTIDTLAPHLREGQILILESTTYPGTTREVVKPVLESGVLSIGETIFLAYSPEREDPGNTAHSTTNTPKIVGADDNDSLQLALALYNQVVTETVAVSSMDVAEAVKLTENIFRAVNIALVNELKTVYSAMGIDIWEVIEAAKTKPFGYMPFFPGPGLGGHCIPIDPFYLTWRAKQFGEETKFIELAGEINTGMPAKIIDVLAQSLKDRSTRELGDASVLVLGVAYKKDVDDLRESPGLKLISLLKRAGASVDYHDPYVPDIPRTREHGDLFGMRSIDLTPQALSSYDTILIATDHSSIDYQSVVKNSNLVVDTRNATHGIAGSRDNVVKA